MRPEEDGGGGGGSRQDSEVGRRSRQDSEVGVVVAMTEEPETEVVVLAVINKEEDWRPALGLKDDLISLALLVGCSSDGSVTTVSDFGLVGAETDF